MEASYVDFLATRKAACADAELHIIPLHNNKIFNKNIKLAFPKLSRPYFCSIIKEKPK